MVETKKMMSPNFAVFNNHVNDAGEKAMNLLNRLAPVYAERISELVKEGNGIMHIFNIEPEDATTAYVWIVTAFVNADRMSDGPDQGSLHEIAHEQK